MNITIKNVDREKARVILNALDFYSRVLSGQLSEISYILRINGKDISDTTVVDSAISILKKEFFPELGTYIHYGISSEKIPDVAKIAYDMIQVLRNKIAYYNNPEGSFTVDFDPVMKVSNDELIEVEISEQDMKAGFYKWTQKIV